MVDRSAQVEGGRLPGAVVAGFVGTVLAGAVLLVGYGIASALTGLPGGLGSALDALTRNAATGAVEEALGRAVVIHFAVGLLLAGVYAWLIEPRLSGPGWRRGVVFALVPWLLSVLVVLPLLGGGVLGPAPSASPSTPPPSSGSTTRTESSHGTSAKIMPRRQPGPPRRGSTSPA